MIVFFFNSYLLFHYTVLFLNIKKIKNKNKIIKNKYSKNK